ncbi:MAG: hypothetical protein H0T53_15055, partial [Herpetosiphonaceae bacterium]|nr:hypothetical protein [Herpetosiphonaceae bacterium]
TYAYVVMDYAGQIKRASDLHIPRHVDARYGAKRGSKNFIHEVANEIIVMAWLWDAWIAIEDTSRKHERIGISRAGNHRFIGVPTQTIASTIDYKAKHMGMLPTHRISNISPRDCPGCYTRRPHEDRPIQIEWFVNCPKCDQKISTDLKLKEALCEACSYTWSIEPFTRRSEEIFSCPKCKGEPWLVRWSLALVIAQRALADIVSHQENSEALRMRKKSNSP